MRPGSVATQSCVTGCGDGFGVTGYAQYAVSWEMFGYPDFMLRDAAVDVALRLEGAAEGRLEQVRTRPDDPFTLRVRLTSPEQVDDGLLGILAEALAQNS